MLLNSHLPISNLQKNMITLQPILSSVISISSPTVLYVLSFSLLFFFFPFVVLTIKFASTFKRRFFVDLRMRFYFTYLARRKFHVLNHNPYYCRSTILLMGWLWEVLSCSMVQLAGGLEPSSCLLMSFRKRFLIL